MAIFRDTTQEKHGDRSAGDRQRHREKVREAIRNNIADIISEESIIGKSRDKIIKVPIRGIREYRFIYGKNMRGVAHGTGDEEPGNVISRKSKNGRGLGAGDQPGADYYETDVTLEEIIDIMFEDLQLPNMERKSLREVEVKSRRRNLGYRKVGIRARMSFRRTSIERIKRIQEQLRGSVVNKERQIQKLIEDLRKASDPEAKKNAGEQIRRNKMELEELYLKKSRFENRFSKYVDKGEKEIRFPFKQRDLRYRHPKEKPHKESNAVVICIMDTSGSMDTLKKYLARSFFFLLYRFILRRYLRVEIAFIAHHTEATEVTEEEFFHKGESGGTFISSGYRKALEIINNRYHPSVWNVYTFHCSDGENFDSDNPAALKAAEELCDVCQLFGYGEIKPSSGWSSMISIFAPLKAKKKNFEIVQINRKEDIWPALKSFLSKSKDAEELL